jgi:putative ABC transport system permease protein
VDLRYAVPKLPPQDAAPGVPAAARTASSAAAPGAVNVARPSRDVCPFRRAGTRPERWNAAERRALRTDRRCARERLGAGSKSLLPYGQTVAVGDADTVTALLGHRDPKAASAMAAGRAVLLDPGYADGGRARLRLYRADPAFADQLPTADREINVPIHLARPDPQRELRNGVVLVLPERMLGRLGLRAQDAGAIWTAAQQPGPGSWRHVEEQLAQISPDRPAELQLERGPGGHDAAPSPTLPFTVPAGLLAIGAAGIATGLAAAESHRDMAVLAAVGAPGRLRRKVAAYQCGFLALLGAVLGSLAGLVPAIGVISANRYLAARDPTGPLWPEPHPVVVPWVDVSVLLVAVPLLAALLAGALTRSLPTRRNRRATGP